MSERTAGGRFREALLVCGGYALLTVIWAYPIPFRLGDTYSNAIDYFLSYWNFWWVKKALLELHQHFYQTSYLFYPTGTSLAFHPFSLYNTLQAVILQVFWSREVAYNLLYLSSLFLSGIGAYLLVRYLVRDRGAAFVGGVLYAFNPYHIINYCHTHVFAIQWIPLYALFLIKMGREARWRNSIVAGVSLTLATMSDWYELVYLLVFTGLFLLFGLLARRRETLNRGFALRLVLLGVTYAVLISPTAWPLLREILAGKTYMYYPWKAGDVQVLGFWLKQTGTFVFLPVLLGYVALGLSLWAVVRRFRDREIEFWTLAGVGFFILALGPHPALLNRSFDSIPLPFLVIYKLPILGSARIANRYLVVTTLALSVLLAFGLKDLKESVLRKSKLRGAAVWVGGALLFFESLAIPFPRYTPAVPKFYQDLAHDPGDYGVIDIPLSAVNSSYMYYQTFHQKKIAGGYIGRNVPEAVEFMESSPVFGLLSHPELVHPERMTPATRSQDLRFLREKKIKYLVLHKRFVRQGNPRPPAGSLKEIWHNSLVPFSLNPKRVYFVPQFPSWPGFALTPEEFGRIRSYLELLCGTPREDSQAVVFQVSD